MMISKHSFLVLPFVLSLFSFSFAHYHDVTPYDQESDAHSELSANSPSYAPFPSPKSSMSTATSTKHFNAGSGSSSSGSGSFEGSGSGSFGASGSSSVSGSGASDVSSSGSSSRAYGPSTSSGSSLDSSISGSGSFEGSASVSGSHNFQGSTSGNSGASGSTNWGSSTEASGAISGSGSTRASASGEVESTFEINLKFSFRKVFAFGDSCTDTGNAKILGVIKDFVGAVISRAFQAANPNFNFGSRSSNGLLVIDFLCDALNIPPLQPYKAASADFNSGVNFAIAGATSLSGDFFANHRIGHGLLWKGIPLGFQTQIEWFNEFVAQIAASGKSEAECRQEIGNSLIWLGQMGVDDFARVIGSSISMAWLTDITILQISKVLTTVLDGGAKFVVVQGLPPVGCWPLAKFFAPIFARDEMGCSAIVNHAVKNHNKLLQQTLEQFRMKYGPEVTIVYADYFNAYKTITSNLQFYGFTDKDQACCGTIGGFLNFNLHILCGMPGTGTCNDPASHVHWDGFHLTEAMHGQIIRLFLTEGFCNPSFEEVIKRHRYLNRQFN